MKHAQSIIIGSALLVALSLITVTGCGGGGDKGTCSTANGCGDDFTEGQWDLINGYFEEGETC